MGRFEQKLSTTIALVLALLLSASMWSHSREQTHLMEARRIWLYVVTATKQLLRIIINIAKHGGHYAHA